MRLTTRSPIWKTASGKNSSIDGPWNSGPSAADVAIRVAVWVNSAGSSFGAPARAGATMVDVSVTPHALREERAGSRTAYQSLGVSSSRDWSSAARSSAVGSETSLTCGIRMRSMTTTSITSEARTLTTRATKNTVPLSQG